MLSWKERNSSGIYRKKMTAWKRKIKFPGMTPLYPVLNPKTIYRLKKGGTEKVMCAYVHTNICVSVCVCVCVCVCTCSHAYVHVYKYTSRSQRKCQKFFTITLSFFGWKKCLSANLMLNFLSNPRIFASFP